MRPNDRILRTRDGQLIAFNLYLPAPGVLSKVLVIAPEAGVDQEFYRPFALWCAEQGIAVFTFDYRGTGLSILRPDSQPSFRLWANQDLDVVLSHVRRRYPREEIILIAHGLSGQIAGLAASIENINYLVLVGCALHSRRLWPQSRKTLAWAKNLFGKKNNAWAKMFLPKSQKLSPHLIQELMDWSSRLNGLFDIFPDNHYRRLNVPLLAYSFRNDPFTPQQAVAELLTHYCTGYAHWERIRPAEFDLPGTSHFGFFDGKCKPLWADMFNWINDAVATKGYFYQV